MRYDEKLMIADKYISDITGGFEWNDLSDINSLHDVNTEEEIKALCDDRLAEDNFESSLID